ncbi:hypothetical protein BH24PSE2_BH24PSE2_04420 [soil metagenome]
MLLHGSPDAQDVAGQNLTDLGLGIAALEKARNEIGIARDILESLGQRISDTIEVGPEADVVHADELDHVVDMVEHVFEARKRVWMFFPPRFSEGSGLIPFRIQIVALEVIAPGPQKALEPGSRRRVEEGGAEIDLNDTTVFGKRLDQLVTHVALEARGEMPRRRVRSDDRSARHSHDVVKCGVRDMRNVHHDADPVHLRHELFAELAQTVPRTLVVEG